MGAIGFPGRTLPVGLAVQLNQNPSVPGQMNASQKFGVLPINLAACQIFNLPAGDWMVNTGNFTFLQWYDPIMQAWRNFRGLGQSAMITSDGFNFRLANLTGSPVGGVITNSGSGYTSAPTITPSAGGATFRAILGCAISTTITITAGGSGYTLPPILLIDPPAAGGVQATATCTISGGAINAVTVTNQGAGYSSTPGVTVIPQPGDTTGTGAVLTAARITSAGTAGAADTVCAIVQVTPGSAQTSVPTFAFAGGGGSNAAATAIMCWTCTGVTSVGLTNGANGGAAIIDSSLTAGSATLTNPAVSTGLFVPRLGYTEGRADLSTATVASPAVLDGGVHQAAGRAIAITNSNGTISGATTWTTAMGGVSDLSFIQMID